ncbi:MAG: TatD family hydrolase [Candidatus Chromulinivorax sp.]
MLIDTHCHINCMLRGHLSKSEFIPFSDFELTSIQEIITQAKNADISTIINVGTDVIESIACIDLAKKFNDCYAIVGIHPNDCTQNWQNDLKKITQFVKNHQDHKIIGIGECGIDLHYEGYNLSRQQDAFKAQIELALQYNLGLSIHSRDAAEETFKIIDAYTKESNFRGIMHCFAYDQSYADQAIKSKLKLGIGGTVTYPKNNILRSIVSNINLEDIVLETDAPFLAPQSVRGTKNCPANIKIIAEFIAKLKNVSYETVAIQTTQNVKNLFTF